MGIEYILITDIGSTTTKALLFREVEGEWRLAGHGESPTTVESPHDDVMIGVWNSIAKIEKNYGVTLLKGDANHFSIQ
ncbi:MAG: glutamate mutase L, partial [Petrimonas sp.]|nr:glutamate mutase L [Petrimonas sp.]